MSNVYSLNLAGHKIRYSFLFPETADYFGKYLKTEISTEYDIRMSEERFSECRKLLPDRDNAYIEDKGLTVLTSSWILKYKCCLFHSVSFIYRNKAWLLSAPSGTGKTTQYRNWKKRYPESITMICGDMPVLEAINNRKIHVHPSPWNGKECIGSLESAPLGGVILLRQENCNEIRMSEDKPIFEILSQFVTVPETESEIIDFAGIADTLLQNYPVWEFGNDGTAASTEILKNFIDEYLGETDGM